MSENKKVTLRKDSTRFLGLIPLESFSGLNLPTNADILRRFFHIRDNSQKKRTFRSIAEEIYNELEVIHDKGPFPMKKKSYSLTKICNLHKKWESLEKNKKTSSEKTVKIFQSELDH